MADPGGARQAAKSSRRTRRWHWVVGISVTGLIVAAALMWFAWLPRYRPTLKPGERYGIDVSHHQGRINWDSVAADGISFVYIKATEGGDFTDPRFRQNWEGAAEAGLARGAYHFFTLCRSGDVQAQNFLNTVPQKTEALPPAVDLEISGNCSERPDSLTVRREIDEFLRIVEAATGRTVVLYVGDDFEDLYPVRRALGRPLWQLEFMRRPRGEDWVIWQVGGFAHVDGIDGNVDLDVMRSAGEYLDLDDYSTA
jgi:lysozyme